MFTPRLDATGMYQSKYYYSENPFQKSGYGLPNCTAYAWGRFYEILGKITNQLPLDDAGKWYAIAQNMGVYETGKTPRLGAIVCYGQSGHSGHVAVVEEINKDGTFTISQSGYYRPIASYPPDTKNYFWLNVCDGTTMKAPWMSAYYFQGFIYCPDIEPPPPPHKAKWHAKEKGGYVKDSEEAKDNGTLIRDILVGKGWTINAICAVLGNMASEGEYNPWRWESDKIPVTPGKSGYGLVQFTGPAYGWSPNKYINSPEAQKDPDYAPSWAGHPGRPEDGASQIRYLDKYADYAKTTKYPLTYSEFKVSEQSVDYLTAAWHDNYERSAHPETIPYRQRIARWWYEYFKDKPPEPPEPPVPPVKKHTGMPLWMYIPPYYW